MGNLICGLKRKKTSEAKNESDEDNTNNVDKDTGKKESKEEVLYATIDHGNDKKAGNAVTIVEGDDCDYAIVKIPSEDKLSIKQDSSDDYVLMG